MNLYGCRKVRVFTDVLETEIDRHGAFGYVEVENPGAEDLTILVNDFPEQGYVGTTLPIKAGTTRHLPLVVYKIKASKAINIIAYGL